MPMPSTFKMLAALNTITATVSQSLVSSSSGGGEEHQRPYCLRTAWCNLLFIGGDGEIGVPLILIPLALIGVGIYKRREIRQSCIQGYNQLCQRFSSLLSSGHGAEDTQGDEEAPAPTTPYDGSLNNPSTYQNQQPHQNTM